MLQRALTDREASQSRSDHSLTLLISWCLQPAQRPDSQIKVMTFPYATMPCCVQAVIYVRIYQYTVHTYILYVYSLSCTTAAQLPRLLYILLTSHHNWPLTQQKGIPQSLWLRKAPKELNVHTCWLRINPWSVPDMYVPDMYMRTYIRTYAHRYSILQYIRLYVMGKLVARWGGPENHPRIPTSTHSL